MSNKIKFWFWISLMIMGFRIFMVCYSNNDYTWPFYYSIVMIAVSGPSALYFLGEFKKETPKIKILNDYIIIEPIEVNESTGLQRTVNDQSKLVYRDALVKFTPKRSMVKPGDTIIFNKSMAYPYIFDGKQHLIITEEYIVCIK